MHPAIVSRFVFTIACVLFVSAACAQEQLEVDVGVSLKETPRQGPVLLFTIRNNSQVELRTRYSSLPWILQRSLILAALPVRTPRHYLTNVHAFQTPTDDELSIPAGKAISGEVILRREFLELEEVLKKSPVVVFWSYQLLTTDGQQSKRFGGFFTIPSQRARLE